MRTTSFTSNSPRVQRRNLTVLTAALAVLLSCSSPALKAGQVWKARALGSTYTYKVKKLQAYKPRIGPLKWRTVDTSATLKAYNPYASDISCGL